MSKISRSSQRTLSQLYAERQHLIHPVPTPICFITTGSVLPEIKWHKFCESFPNSKLHGYCARKRNGAMQFNGEYGLDAAAMLQIKFPNRFHFVLLCDNFQHMKEALIMAKHANLHLAEIDYKDGNNRNISIGDPQVITEMMRKAA